MKVWNLSILLFILMTACEEKMIVLLTESVSVTSPSDIQPLGDSTVAPLLYQSIPYFDSLTIEESKEKFIASVLPAVLVAKYRLKQDRLRVKQLLRLQYWKVEDSIYYDTQLARFNAQDSTGLLSRMRLHPNSIILAQAIVESGWGSSRFFQEANNLFGIWSYAESEPRIAANVYRGDQVVYLRKYTDVSESITDYFETVGRSRAYRFFRREREKTNKVDELLPHLRYYSERRDDYVQQLRTIISQNDLEKYDRFQIDPDYFVEQSSK